jgi:glycosyltransferase involved in cell wall biosynthesis
MISLVGVVVPAADEQETVAACLASLAVARRHLHRSARRLVRVRIVVVLDSCTDGTAEIVAGQPDVEAIATTARRVGIARAVGAAHLLRVAPVPAGEIWLANTDADSVVPPDWLSVAVEEADRGADLLVGTVRPGPGLSAATELAWRRRHVQRNDHPHVHGTNLGVRASAYLALGGWAPVATGEDTLLVGRASSAGHLRVRRTAAIAVHTSTRRAGRAPHGFAGYLRGLAGAEPTEPTVGSAAS